MLRKHRIAKLKCAWRLKGSFHVKICSFREKAWHIDAIIFPGKVKHMGICFKGFILLDKERVNCPVGSVVTCRLTDSLVYLTFFFFDR